MPYPIPPKPDEVRLTCRRIFIPDQIDIISCLYGVAALMTEDRFWIQGDSDWPKDDLIQLIQQGLAKSDVDEDCNMICSIQWTVAAIVPEGWLLADGSIVLADDYPDYAAACDPSLVVSPSEVRLPDLVNRFAVGAGDIYPVNDMGGETEHTLTIAEMPSHNHTETAYSSNIDVESAGAPDPFAIGLPTSLSNTGSTGGGGAHNNMPPYYGAKPIVRMLP